LGLREREDVQRVLRDHIQVISPDTLILAEEFGHWEDSRRRIDLLGIDRDRCLVVIELKRTEDGGHMELQALRYAAMVSTLSFDQAVEINQKYRESRGQSPESAESDIRAFLEIEEGPVVFNSQVRIVLASADFSKEITSTVLWLNASGLDILCVRIRPHTFQGRVLLDVQQVIPLPEAAAFQVAIRAKSMAQVTAQITARDYTRYRMKTSLGEEFSNLPKRRFIYNIVKEALRLGVHPNSIANAVPWRQRNFFVSAPGALSSEALFAAHPQKEASRYFCEDSELFHDGGVTYAMTNQWGNRTEDAVANILALLPIDHGIRYDIQAKWTESL